MSIFVNILLLRPLKPKIKSQIKVENKKENKRYEQKSSVFKLHNESKKVGKSYIGKNNKKQQTVDGFNRLLNTN